MEHMNRQKIISRRSLGKTLWYFVIILCLMVPFLTGVLIFVLGCIPILFASLVPFTGLKLAQVSLPYLRGTISALKAQRYSTPSENDGEIFHHRN